jgi:hypothetical protein
MWPSVQQPISKDKNVMARTRKYYLKNHYLWQGVLDITLYDKVCQWLVTGQWFSLGTPISSTNKTDSRNIAEILLKVALNTITLVMARTRKYYLKNHYLTLRSKVTVPQRSLRYTTHRLMVMHPHTKYYWPISKDKKVMVRTSFAEKKRKKKSD